MLICEVCGYVFDEDSEEWRAQVRRHGSPDGKCWDCPCCGNDSVHEATKCKKCGEYFYDEDGCVDACPDCMEKFENVGDALLYGATRTESVEVNGLINYLLSPEQINEVLTKYVEEHFTDHHKNVVAYCELDKEAFANWIVEEGE